MKSIKHLLEKPQFIWFLIALAYGVMALSWVPHQANPAAENRVLEAMAPFADGGFPPRIAAIRELKDWNGLGYYALMGRLAYALKHDLNKIRIAHGLIVLLAFFVFLRLGRHFTYRNRLDPIWVTAALLLLAINPYVWRAAMYAGPLGPLLLLLLLGLWAYENDRVGWSALFTSLAALIDWTGILLAAAFIVTRVTEERGRVVRPLRLAYFLAPIVVGALPFVAWEGTVPLGDPADWLIRLKQERSPFQLSQLFYALALLPLYSLWFSWAWGFKARTRALGIGAVVTGLAIPLFFMAPITPDVWELARSGLDQTLGLLDEGALRAAGEYKNLVLFLPYLAGVFLVTQLALMDVLDRSRSLRFFIFFFLAIQPLSPTPGDGAFAIVVPFLCLLSLSEALVGEEGNLSRV